MQKKMQKEKNVNKFICLFACITLIGCNTNKNLLNSKISTSSYEIKKFKSSDNWITINAYDNEISYGRLMPIIKINKLFFFNDGIRTFNVEESKHNIQIFHIGKIPITIKDLVIKKGDSIVINAYLKDDPRPIND